MVWYSGRPTMVSRNFLLHQQKTFLRICIFLNISLRLYVSLIKLKHCKRFTLKSGRWPRIYRVKTCSVIRIQNVKYECFKGHLNRSGNWKSVWVNIPFLISRLKLFEVLCVQKGDRFLYLFSETPSTEAAIFFA